MLHIQQLSVFSTTLILSLVVVADLDEGDPASAAGGRTQVPAGGADHGVQAEPALHGGQRLLRGCTCRSAQLFIFNLKNFPFQVNHIQP